MLLTQSVIRRRSSSDYGPDDANYGPDDHDASAVMQDDNQSSSSQEDPKSMLASQENEKNLKGEKTSKQYHTVAKDENEFYERYIQ